MSISTLHPSFSLARWPPLALPGASRANAEKRAVSLFHCSGSAGEIKERVALQSEHRFISNQLGWSWETCWDWNITQLLPVTYFQVVIRVSLTVVTTENCNTNLHGGDWKSFLYLIFIYFTYIYIYITFVIFLYFFICSWSFHQDCENPHYVISTVLLVATCEFGIGEWLGLSLS